MSVIIRLQNLPWSANAMDIRNYFRGLSIPEGGVHIVGGEQGDAFIAFSTDEDARQAMMNDGGKIKEIQVKLLLSSRSEMHKVIEAARQSVPILQLQPQPVMVPPTPFTPALSSILNPGIKQSITSNTIPGLGSPMEIPPQPAVIEPPVITSTPDGNDELEQDKDEKKKDQKSERRRTRSRSRSREREKKDNRRDRKDRRDRSRSRDRSRERRRRERSRSRSRERRDRKRDRRERSRSRERSKDTIQNRRSRDMRSEDKRNDASEHSNSSFADKTKKDIIPAEKPFTPQANFPSNTPANMPQNIPLNIPQNIQAMQAQLQATLQSNMPLLNPMSRPFAAFGNGNPVMGLAGNARPGGEINRFANDNGKMDDTYSRLQELGNKRNPNAFQGSDKSGPGPGLRRPPGDRDQQGYVGRDDRNLDRDLNNHQQRRFNRAVPPNCCIKMTNVPTYLGYGDVRRFFAGNFISNQGIKMINDHRGRRTGIVYIKFNELKGKQAALSKDGWEMNNERVKVEHADDKEFDNAIDAYMPIRHVSDDEHEETTSQSSLILVENDESQRFRGPFTVLRISDLPNYTKEHDLIKKFSDYSLLSIMLMDCKQTKTRTAYIQFVKSEDAKAAFQKKELYLFGRKQAPVSPCSEDDYEKEKNNYNKDIQHSNEEPAPAVEAPRDPRQRRLPAHNSEATTTTAQPLFPPGSVFPPPVFPGPPFVNPGAFPGPGFPPALMPGGPRPLWSAASQVPADEESVDCVLMKGLSPRASDRTIIDFFSEVKVVPSRIHLMLDHNGRPSGDCFCEFRTPEEASLAASRRGSLLENREISIDLVDRKVVEDALEGPKIEHSHSEALLGDGPQFRGPAPMMRGDFNQRGSFRGGFFNGPPRGRGIFDRGGFRGRGGPPMRGGRGFIRGGPRGGFNSFNGGNGGGSDESSTVPDSFGKPGCVVSLENVPFRAGIEEILEFFSNFELTQDDVIRRFNDRGMPTGDARVCFRTPFDAQRAVKTLNMSPIRDRPVGLQIV